jgi:hypothetical protein
MRKVYLRDLKPFFQKNRWALRPVSVLLLLFVAWWLVPAVVLWENRREVFNAIEDLWAMVWTKPIE